MPTWPTDLPQIPLRDGFLDEPEDLAVRDEPDIGSPLTRPIATAYGTNFTMKMIMTKVQKLSIKTFYFSTLVSGTLSFDWIHPDEKTAGKFIFTEVPKWPKLAADVYLVSFKLYMKP